MLETQEKEKTTCSVERFIGFGKPESKPESKRVFLKNKRLWLGLAFGSALALVIGMGSFVAGQGKSEKPVKRAITVETARVDKHSLAREIKATGTVMARDPLEIGSQASGLKIDLLLAEEGDWVEKGQILARLNTDILNAQLKEEQAILDNAAASYQKSLQPNRQEEINMQRASLDSTAADIAQKEAAIARASAEYNNALSISERYSSLYREGGATAQEAEQKRTDVQSYKAALETAKEGLRQAKLNRERERLRLDEMQTGGRREDISIAASTVAQHRARIEQLQAQIAQAIVRAPDAGLIVERSAHLGEIYNGGIIYKMIRNGELELQAKLPQQDLDQIRLGQEVLVSDGKRTLTGKVWLLAPSVDSTSRLGKIRIALPTDKDLKAGMFVTTTIATVSRDSLAVPESALAYENDKASVLVIENGIAHKRRVNTGLRHDRYVEILDGLQAGETIVKEGTVFVADGDLVRSATL